MAWGIFNKIKKGLANFGKKVKEFANDFKDGFKHGWNKTKSIMEKLPIVGDVASVIPAFDNSNNPVTKHFGNDGYVYFDQG